MSTTFKGITFCGPPDQHDSFQEIMRNKHNQEIIRNQQHELETRQPQEFLGAVLNGVVAALFRVNDIPLVVCGEEQIAAIMACIATDHDDLYRHLSDRAVVFRSVHAGGGFTPIKTKTLKNMGLIDNSN